jgi:hypothetical protein
MKHILRPANIALAFLFGLLTFFTRDLDVPNWLKWAGHFGPMILIFIGAVMMVAALWTLVKVSELIDSYIKWYNKKYND